MQASSTTTASWPDVPFEAIVEQSVAGIYVIQDDHFVYANATWAAMAGYTPKEVIGMPLARIVPPDFLAVVRERVQARLDGKPPSMRFITRGLHRDGHVVMVEVHGSRMDYRGRPAVVGVGVDVTERLHNEAELRRSLQQLQAFSSHTAAKLEEQRGAFARDLHEVLGGMLSAIRVDAVRALRLAEGAELQALVQELLALAQQASEAVKEMSDAQRPGTPARLDGPQTGPAHLRLSARETQIMQLLLKGMSLTEIGERMQISVKTVSTHRSHILAKLGVASTAELVLYAVRQGLVQ
ncbi:PAS domain S-box protein [Variovorax sp. LARHSF232]